MSFFTSNPWIFFMIIFAIFAKSVWFIYYFSLYGFERKRYERRYKGTVAMVVPVYNEDESKLAETVEHVKKAKGLDQVIFVNDGSTRTDVAGVLAAHNDGSYTVINLPHNAGKRRAQKAGLALVDADVVVFMDSDTLIRPGTIIELTKPMNDPEVGGATACILVANRTTNFLTRCVSAMYWTASNIWRKAPANLGFMQVTNGQLSCYRTKFVKRMLAAYVSQRWMGVECTCSDDRYITHHIQIDFHKRIVYQESAVAYTYIPETVPKTYRMLLRWKQGSLRETFLLFTRPTKLSLILDTVSQHLIMFLQTIVRVAIIFIAFKHPIVALYYLGIIAVISMLFAYELLWRDPKQLPYKVAYSILDELIFRWVFVHALVTIRNQGRWGTR